MVQEGTGVAIAMDIYEKIRYYQAHTDYSQRTVAKMLGISRNTVKKYWKGQAVPWDRKPGSGRRNDIITADVKEFIAACIESDKNVPKKQRHTAHRIYERLVKECGFEGCEASVRRTVAEMRSTPRDVFVPLAYEPAEAIQIDWGEATVILAGTKQTIQLWCMRECSSGDCFVTAFYRQNEESFLEGIVKGLEYFGGVPQKMIFDNARVAVKEGFGHHAKATDKYLALSAHYAFRPVFCNPAQGHEKGLVEGLVGLVRRNHFVPMLHIESLEELNTGLLAYCRNYRDHKIPGKSMTVGEMAEICSDKWIPLPPYRFDTSNTVQVQADDFSLVKFDHNKYSVPYRFSGKTVTVKGSGNKVKMLYRGEMIAEYDRDYRHDRTHYRLEHYIGLIEKRPRSVYHAAPVKETVPKAFFNFLMKLQSPKEIVKALRLYLDEGDTLLQYLPYADSYETLYACTCKAVVSAITTAPEIHILMPNLQRYDSLLRGGESV